MPGLQSADFAAADILGDVLGSERGSLYALVPDGKALMARFSYQAKPGVGFGLALAAFPTGEDPTALLAEVRRVIADIAKNGAPPALVEAAKRREVAQIGFEANSISGLASNWSEALAFRAASSPDDVAKVYESVTVDDVNRLARQLLDPDQSVTAILTPRGNGAPVSQSAFGGAESFAAAPDHPVTLPSWAEAALGTPHIPDPGKPPVTEILPNGIHLIVQPEYVSQTVSLFGRVRTVADTQQPHGKDGVSGIMRQLFDYGTTTHDRLGFRADRRRHRRLRQGRPEFLGAGADARVRQGGETAGRERAAPRLPRGRVQGRAQPTGPERRRTATLTRLSFPSGDREGDLAAG